MISQTDNFDPYQYINIILAKKILIYCQRDVFEILMEIKILAISQLVLSLLSLTCGPIVHLVKIMLLPMKAYMENFDPKDFNPIYIRLLDIHW